LFFLTQLAIGAEQGSATDAVGYVDASGVLAAAAGRPENFTAYASGDAARAALDAGEIRAIFVVDADYLRTGDVTLFTLTDANEAIRERFDDFLRANLRSGMQPQLAARLADPVTLDIQTIDNGRTITEEGAVSVFLAPLIFVVVFLVSSQVTSGYLMSSVVEEKSTRMMEMLVTTVTPAQLLSGKIIGLGLLGLTQIGIWVAAGALVLAVAGDAAILQGFAFPPDLLLIGLLYFVLGYFFLSSLMAGIGAVIGSEQESRQVAGILSLPLSVPFFFILQFLTAPDSPIVIFLSLFPLTSPVAVLLRMGFGAIPPLQLVISLGLLLLTTLAAVWASARLFRWSLLMYGKAPSLRQIVRALVRDQGMQTTATGERAG
jgi:ABC-2 type transport system permease protein